MTKELLTAGRPYLWAIYYALFILSVLIFISGFRFVTVGLIFLIPLLLKSYAGNKLVIDFFCWYKTKGKLLHHIKHIKLNSVIVGVLLWMDVILLVHLPEVFRQTYTLSAFVLFLLVSAYCIMSRWKSNYTNVYTQESASTEIPSR